MLRSLLTLGAALLAASVVFTMVAQVSAQGPTLTIDRKTVVEGEDVKVNLEALGVTGLGLGAWQLQVHYNPDIIQPVGCTSNPNGYCNTNYGSSLVAIVGATGGGITGDINLASITFRCRDIGQSALTIVVKLIADGTNNAPQPIAIKVVHGALSCLEQTPANVPGDVDCSGSVTSRDALLVLQFEAGLIRRLACEKNGDLNGDGEINSIDAQFIKKFVVGFLDDL